jgi:hypothetical protein
MIEQMHEGKRRPQYRHRPIGAHGFAQAEQNLIDIEAPRAIGLHAPAEKGIARTEFTPRRFEHVHKG